MYLKKKKERKKERKKGKAMKKCPVWYKVYNRLMATGGGHAGGFGWLLFKGQSAFN